MKREFTEKEINFIKEIVAGKKDCITAHAAGIHPEDSRTFPDNQIKWKDGSVDISAETAAKRLWELQENGKLCQDILDNIAGTGDTPADMPTKTTTVDMEDLDILQGIKDTFLILSDCAEKIGEQVYDLTEADDNNTSDMGKAIHFAFEHCNSLEEFTGMNRMLIAITGNDMGDILNKIQERDRNGYMWECHMK